MTLYHHLAVKKYRFFSVWVRILIKVKLLTRKFLPDVRLILTSRPHSILNFQKSIQPNYVLYIDDLSKKNMKALFQFFIKTENVDEILYKLLEKSPKIQQLTLCPLYLRLFCHLYEVVGDEIWKVVESTASLFDKLITNLLLSAHKRQ